MNSEPLSWLPEEAAPTEAFDNDDLAKHALNDYAIRNGFALVVKRLQKNVVILACSQGGIKRSHTAGDWAPNKGIRTLRAKKIGCNFEVKLVRAQTEPFEWTVSESEEPHSIHAALTDDSISSLPAARRHLLRKYSMLKQIEEKFDPTVSTNTVRFKLRQTYAWLTFKDVDNALCTIKKKVLDGLTDIEALHQKLKVEAVVSDSLRDEENRLVRLFFSPKASHQLKWENTDVLLLDCTYKTNSRMMPLLHVVGVTGSQKQFTVACCFMNNELEESYVWALERTTRSLPWPPLVAVVDNRTALINALALVWPSCSVHLCR